ncbi:multi-sensor signal transduction histidine kinase [Deinococcus phoenicis]|uniref:histidine kinase n=2 Tax=Deinococcus phoenicis TaxID=1476583 RepID=A0A016QUY2_9DEIO|nr:multi-sensor signal transduction histidine kinase [Deinococcus phoenicis]
MSARMRTFDWSATPLGSPDTWPQSLKTTVRIMLTSRFAMWMLWGDDLTFFYNDAYRPTLGVKDAWALGSPSDQVWAEIWKDIWPRIEHVLDTGEATWDEGLRLILERSGYPEETYHTFSYSPLADDSGRVTGMLCVVTEESERVVGERRLRVLRDLAAGTGEARTPDEVLAALSTSLGPGTHDLPFALVYLPGEEGTLRLAAAPGFREGTGHTPGVLNLEEQGGTCPACDVFLDLTPRLTDLAAPDALPPGPWDRPPTQALVLPLAQAGQTRPAGVFVAALNPYRPLDEGYRGFLDLFVGQIAAALANANAYEEERRRAEALAELDRAKTAFFANASHELRTPLTLMLGPLEDLLTGDAGPLTGAQRGVLDMAHRNSLRLLRLVNTLLDFSRLEAGRAQASYVPTDLATVTADLASSFRSAVERAGLGYTVEVSPLAEPVYLDPELWEKVVLNLLSNAFKFTLSGHIRVTLAQEGREAVLRVRDSGVGIPAGEVPRLFERFHRVEGQRGRSFEGTGIGLALVREIVELHGGRVEAQSVEGQGTTFTVRLPLGTAHLPGERLGAERSQTSTAVGALPYVEEALRWLPDPPDRDVADEGLAGPDRAPLPGERGRVLLVDDNADLREYIARLLAPGHDVQVVPDGQAALEALAESLPDLIITDVMMPRLDGFGLLRALREDPRTRELPVIMLSARAGEEARVQGLTAGADDYLVKPFSARELLAKVGANLALSRMRRAALEREQAYSAELETRVAERAREVVQWRDRYEVAVQGAGALIYDWNPATNEILYGGALEHITGYRAGELLGRLEDWTERLIHPDDRAAFAREIGRVLDTGEAFGLGFRVVRQDGSVLEVEDDGYFTRDEAGRVLRMVGFVRDVTERRRAEDALRRANEELQRSNAELERFAYIASHDLQEPIRTVGSFAGLLGRRYGDVLDERGQQYLHTVELGALRMKTLVDDLLVFSRLNAALAPLQPVEMGAPLREALARLDSALQEAGARVVVGELPTVQGDAPRLVQLFQNLIANAVKFRREGVAPEVTVGAVREGDWQHFTVSDNGIGIEEAYFGRIFEMFQRLYGRDRYEGSGLGLAICQKIVAQHGGRMWVESAPGVGSTFHFTLPSAPVPSDRQPAGADA